MLIRQSKAASLFLTRLCVLTIFIAYFSAALAQPNKSDIIYEYQFITQKKGLSFKETFEQADLTAYQRQLLLTLPLIYNVNSDRVFRVAYALVNNQRRIREVKVTRGNRIANFVLTDTPNDYQFVSKASQIPVAKLPKTPKLAQQTQKQATQSVIKTASQISASTKRFGDNETYFSQTVTQKKGQSLNNALAPLGLTKLQQNIIGSGDFIKSARSQRQITAYFAGSASKKLLRGLRVERNGKQVNYRLEKKANSFKLRNIKTDTDAVKQRFLALCATANKTAVGATKASVSKSTATGANNKKTTRVTATIRTNARVKSADSGNYHLLRLTQHKGKSLASAMRGQPLSSLQKKLLHQIPVTSAAKSTRYFYLLFEKNGNNKYLKAVRVQRGNNVASFALVRYRGKWHWGNSKGQITTGGGFMRYPLHFKRISSGFNLRRRHPITRRIRPHRGTDFAARHGTPIWAPADGVVIFAGRQRGFGITLEIDHGNGYKTKYAHLSRILRDALKGKRVKKKQIIAKVGNTGLSSGSHLHYEVHVNGVPRNPMRVKLPNSGGGIKTLPEAKAAIAKYLPQIRRMM